MTDELTPAERELLHSIRAAYGPYRLPVVTMGRGRDSWAN